MRYNKIKKLYIKEGFHAPYVEYIYMGDTVGYKDLKGGE